MRHKLLAFMATALFLLPTAVQAKVHYLTLPAATGSGTYQYFTAVAQMFSKVHPDINITISSSSGTVENLRLLGAGETEMCSSNASIAHFAYDGKDVFKEKIPMRGMFIYDMSNYHIITLDKNINSIEDLAGKTISIGLVNSLMEKVGSIILDVYELTDKVKIHNLSLGESCTALKDGNIDAALLVNAVPQTSIMELATSRDLKFIPVPAGLAAKVNERLTTADGIIPAGTYPNQKEDLASFAWYEGFFAHPDADPELVYTFLKVLFSNIDELASLYPRAAKTSPQLCMDGMNMPLHPGAARYYEEIGLTIPNRIKPID